MISKIDRWHAALHLSSLARPWLCRALIRWGAFNCGMSDVAVPAKNPLPDPRVR